MLADFLRTSRPLSNLEALLRSIFHLGNHCTFLGGGVWRQDWPRLSSPVRSLEVATGILSFGLVEAGARVVILDTVFISERLRGEFFFFVGGGVVGSGGGFVSWGRVVWPGGSDGGDGGEDEELKRAEIELELLRTFLRKLGFTQLSK